MPPDGRGDPNASGEDDASPRAPGPSAPDAEGPDATVLLVIERDANRRQVAAWLDERYTVERTPDGPTDELLDRCDLCLVDGPSFGRHRDALVAAKERAAPVFRPYLLLRTGSHSRGSERDLWSVADEVIETPISRAKLRARIDVLLRARGYSVALTRQNERLERFASVLSHDLRNPLNVAQGRLDLATSECDSEHLAHVERAHDRIETLIEDILALAREGETVTDPAVVDLAAVVERCWRTVETADATLVVRAEGSIYADRSRLQRLFENLLRNAIEHGGDDVTITVGDLEGGGFYVEDDGPGVPDAVRERAFESGYSTSTDGTGFGLAIVSEIAAAHGWDIALTDGADGGARFEVDGVERAE